MAIVYRHRRLDTFEVFYVGIGNKVKRAFSKKDRNTWWKNIVNKTGYTIEVIQDNLSWEEACDLEVLLIKEYGRQDLGTGVLVNMTEGGDGASGRVQSEESKRKRSESAKGRIPSKESVDKIREYYRNNKPQNYIGFSEDVEQEIVYKYTIEKLSIENIGKHYNVSRKKISSVLKSNNIEIRQKKLIEPNYFYELYITQGKTRVEISKILECAPGSLDKIVKKYKIYKNE